MLRNVVDTSQFLLYTTRSIRPAPASLPRRADGDLVLHSPPVRSQTYRTRSSGFGLLQSQSMAYSFGRNYHELLNVPRTASLAETYKTSYHQLLLSSLTSRTRPRTTRPERMSTLDGSRTHSSSCFPQNPG